MQIRNNNGIEVRVDGKSIFLDPKESKGDLVFISHSHFDHILRSVSDTPKICSRITKETFEIRTGIHLPNTYQSYALDGIQFELINSGHILGSSSLLIKTDKKILYTGDVNTRDRLFIKGFKPRDCDVLILETTFGTPRYVFPPIREIEKEVKDWVHDCIRKNNSVILMGYSLGKSQLISYLFKEYKQIIHASVLEINKVYRQFGVDIPIKTSYADAKEKIADPYIFICPPLSANNPIISHLKKKTNPKTAVFSGWALDPGYKYQTGADMTFPLSDHCDFTELKYIADKCNPEKIYTYHGFATDFAEYLTKKGFDAEPL